MAVACPPDDKLKKFLVADLQAAEEARLATHIDHCSRCQSMLDTYSEVPAMDSLKHGSATVADKYESEAPLIELLKVVESPERTVIADTPPPSKFTRSTYQLEDSQEGDVGRIGPYRILRELGRGGMGVVYLAFDEDLRRQVAIKMLLPNRMDDESRDRFVNEARATARVKHDNLVNVFAVHNPPDRPPYFVMEYIDGPSLRDKIERAGPINPRELAEICAQSAEGLDAAHKQSLIHRDIKPGNILIDKATGRAKVSDFGLARDTDESLGLTREGQLIGTPSFMSPEQIREPASCDGRTDVYSLGVTLYQGLAREVPFKGTVAAIVKQVTQEDPPPPSRFSENVPRDLETICLKAMSKEAHKRFGTCGEMAEELRRYLRGEPILSRPISAFGRLRRWAERNPKFAALALAAVIMAISITIGSLAFSWQLTNKQKTIEDLAEQRLKAQQLAELKADDAEQQHNISVDALNALVYEVDQKLVGVPGATRARKELLDTSLRALRKIVDRANSTKSINKTLVDALIYTSRVQISMGQHNDGRLTLEQACSHADELVRNQPDSLEFALLKANAHDELGSVLTGLHDAQKSIEHVRIGLECREQIAKQHPELDEIKLSLGNSAINMILALNLQNRSEEAYNYAKLGTKYLEEFNAKRPDDVNGIKTLRRIYSTRAGMCSSTLRATEAVDCAKKQLELAKRLLASNPNDVSLMRTAGFAYGTLAAPARAADEVQLAIESSKMYLQIAKSVRDLDPENIIYERDIGFALMQLGQAQVRAQQFNEARQTWNQAGDHLKGIIQKYPTEIPALTDFAIVCSYLLELTMRMGEWDQASRWASDTIAILEQTPGVDSKIRAGLINQAKAYSGIIALRQQIGDDLEKAKALPAEKRQLGLLLQGIAHARAGKIDQVDRCIQATGLVDGVGFQLSMAAAQMYSRAAEALRKNRPVSKLNEAESKRYAEYIRRGLHELERAIFTDKADLSAEPDLDELRQTSEYKRWTQKTVQ